MSTYFMAETEANGFILDDKFWEPLNATDLKSAKAETSKNQCFHGTSLHIAELINGDYVSVAVKRPDALNMRHTGRWTNL